MTTFKATTDGTDKLGLRAVLERYVNGPWLPDHDIEEQRVGIVLTSSVKTTFPHHAPWIRSHSNGSTASTIRRTVETGSGIRFGYEYTKLIQRRLSNRSPLLIIRFPVKW